MHAPSRLHSAHNTFALTANFSQHEVIIWKGNSDSFL